MSSATEREERLPVVFVIRVSDSNVSRCVRERGEGRERSRRKVGSETSLPSVNDFKTNDRNNPNTRGEDSKTNNYTRAPCTQGLRVSESYTPSPKTPPLPMSPKPKRPSQELSATPTRLPGT